jgi:hypothetical protein
MDFLEPVLFWVKHSLKTAPCSTEQAATQEHPKKLRHSSNAAAHCIIDPLNWISGQGNAPYYIKIPRDK